MKWCHLLGFFCIDKLQYLYILKINLPQIKRVHEFVNECKRNASLQFFKHLFLQCIVNPQKKRNFTVYFEASKKA